MKKKTTAFHQAMLTRDPRFDGKFFIGVKTTGIYCRPICPARPKAENVEFFTDALSAERAGYRPCLRCRPESAPLSPAWAGKSATVARALRLIGDQKLLEQSENEFAGLLGVSARHLRRLFEEELGKTPKQISDLQRLDFARKLLTETQVPVTEIAYASGFSSIRRFNDAVKKRFHRTPSELRATRRSENVPDRGIRLSLSYRPPLDWNSLLEFFEVHAIPGAEAVREGGYERVFSLEGSLGGLRLEAARDQHQLQLHVVTQDSRHLFRVVRKLRQMFDLDSDPIQVAAHFSECSLLSGLSKKYPGLRIARGWDAFETSIGSVLGQLVSTEQARRMLRQLVEAYGKKVTHPLSGEAAWIFPAPGVLAKSSLNQVGTTNARKETIREFSRLVLSGKISLEPTQDPAAFRRRILMVKGIGPWTADYIALRALGDTDAFPGTDLILKRATELHAPDLETLRPWRGYAATYFWKEFAKSLSKKGKKHHEAHAIG